MRRLEERCEKSDFRKQSLFAGEREAPSGLEPLYEALQASA
jgi:hypothetical protein